MREEDEFFITSACFIPRDKFSKDILKINQPKISLALAMKTKKKRSWLAYQLDSPYSEMKQSIYFQLRGKYLENF
jgi:hypothetical protein